MDLGCTGGNTGLSEGHDPDLFIEKLELIALEGSFGGV